MPRTPHDTTFKLTEPVSTRDKLLELVLDGKLTEDKIGRLEKLITMLDGPKDKASHFDGYA